jgi:hypothetical protein
VIGARVGAVAMLCASTAWAQPGTQPLGDAIVVRGGGPCIAQADLVDRVGKWLRTRQVDPRLAVLVTRRDAPQPTLSFWVWRDRQEIAERHFPEGRSSCEDLRAALALAIALAIDATVLEPRDEAPSPPPPPANPRPVRRPMPPPPPAPARAGAWIGSGVTSVPGLGLSLHAGAFALPWSLIRAELDAAATLTEAHRSSAAGRARLRLGSLRLGASLEPWPEARISPSIGVGAGPLFAWATADPDPGHRAGRDHTLVTVVSGRGRLSLRLSRQVQLFLQGDVSVTIPRLTVRSPDTAAASPLLELVFATSYRW